MRSLSSLAARETEFLNWYARRALVAWCADQLVKGPKEEFDPTVATRDIPNAVIPLVLDYAREKKWVSAKGNNILSGGWKVATSFCKKG